MATTLDLINEHKALVPRIGKFSFPLSIAAAAMFAALSPAGAEQQILWPAGTFLTDPGPFMIGNSNCGGGDGGRCTRPLQFGTACWTPVKIPNEAPRMNGIGIFVSADTGNPGDKIRLAIYNSVNSKPANLVVDAGEAIIPQPFKSGFSDVLASAPVSLPAPAFHGGWYWLGIMLKQPSSASFMVGYSPDGGVGLVGDTVPSYYILKAPIGATASLQYRSHSYCAPLAYGSFPSSAPVNGSFQTVVSTTGGPFTYLVGLTH